jgi:zinc transporter ZupT
LLSPNPIQTKFIHHWLSGTTVVSLQKSEDASVALTVAAVWTGLIHLALGVLGTFVLKRFPTSFSVGFFLGVLVVLANQNIILYASFHKYTQGSGKANQVFAFLGFLLFSVLTFMTLLLVHFKNDVVISPMGSVPSADENENALA